MAQDILSRLKVIIGADNRQFLSGIQKSQQQIVGFQKDIQNFARVAGAALAAVGAGSAIFELVELREKAAGVKIAFD